MILRVTLVIAVTPYVARIMRASMVEVLESDYVEMARLKGMPERTVLVVAACCDHGFVTSCCSIVSALSLG